MVPLDLGLPAISGPELLEKMRADPRLAKIPVAAMTGSSPERLEYVPAADELLVKPFDLERLNGALSTLCRKARSAAVA